nr:MAG TPA: hypothetical protein [Caudoviricetes sp.]
MCLEHTNPLRHLICLKELSQVPIRLAFPIYCTSLIQFTPTHYWLI